MACWRRTQSDQPNKTEATLFHFRSIWIQKWSGISEDLASDCSSPFCCHGCCASQGCVRTKDGQSKHQSSSDYPLSHFQPTHPVYNDGFCTLFRPPLFNPNSCSNNFTNLNLHPKPQLQTLKMSSPKQQQPQNRILSSPSTKATTKAHKGAPQSSTKAAIKAHKDVPLSSTKAAASKANKDVPLSTIKARHRSPTSSPDTNNTNNSTTTTPPPSKSPTPTTIAATTAHRKRMRYRTRAAALAVTAWTHLERKKLANMAAQAARGVKKPCYRRRPRPALCAEIDKLAKAKSASVNAKQAAEMAALVREALNGYVVAGVLERELREGLLELMGYFEGVGFRRGVRGGVRVVGVEAVGDFVAVGEVFEVVGWLVG